MIESGLMKKPFIGSNVDGLKEIVDNGFDGILYECENVGSLTNSLITLIPENNLRIRLGEELYRKVINNFTSEKIIPLYILTYRKLLS